MLNVTSKSENETFLITRICEFTEAFDIKQAKAGWLYSFLSFLPETSKLQSAVYSEWK